MKPSPAPRSLDGREPSRIATRYAQKPGVPERSALPGWFLKSKGVAVQDVAVLGGWTGTKVLEDIYQKADRDNMERVLLEGQKVELRVVSWGCKLGDGTGTLTGTGQEHAANVRRRRPPNLLYNNGLEKCAARESNPEPTD